MYTLANVKSYYGSMILFVVEFGCIHLGLKTIDLLSSFRCMFFECKEGCIAVTLCASNLSCFCCLLLSLPKEIEIFVLQAHASSKRGFIWRWFPCPCIPRWFWTLSAFCWEKLGSSIASARLKSRQSQVRQKAFGRIHGIWVTWLAWRDLMLPQQEM